MTAKNTANHHKGICADHRLKEIFESYDVCRESLSYELMVREPSVGFGMTGEPQHGIREFRSNIFERLYKIPDNLQELLWLLFQFSLSNDVRLLDTSGFYDEQQYYHDIAVYDKKNNRFVLVEHQSTNDPNMVARFFHYYTHFVHEEYRNFPKNKDGIIQIPEPWFFLCLNGRATKKDDILTLQKHFERSSKCIGTMLHVYVSLLDFDTLPHDVQSDINSVTAGCTYLIKRVEGYQRVGLKDFFHRAVVDCTNKGYLIEYLRDKEVRSIMTSIEALERAYQKDHEEMRARLHAEMQQQVQQQVRATEQRELKLHAKKLLQAGVFKTEAEALQVLEA